MVLQRDGKNYDKVSNDDSLKNGRERSLLILFPVGKLTGLDACLDLKFVEEDEESSHKWFEEEDRLSTEGKRKR